jgi:cytochrome c-type biogenesis protein CcmH/NrfF
MEEVRTSKTGIKVIESTDSAPHANRLSEQLLMMVCEMREILEQIADVTDSLQEQIDELKGGKHGQ